jgi:tripartite-type tricarboxylate transporter receptor subunit TctC
MKIIFSALLACLLWTSQLSAQTPFYEGKTIRIVVGFSPGAAYDVWARLLAQHWGKFIPGSPSFVVQNMPGGGSLIAANHVYNIAKPDGLTIGFVTPGIYIEQLTGRTEVKHDWLKFSHVGSPESTARIFIIRADFGYKTIEDLRKAAVPPKCGALGVGSATYYWPKLLADSFGFKLNLVLGYGGGADVHLAIEKGEMHCWGGTVQNSLGTEPSRSWFKTGFIRALAQGGQKRHPQLPEVPTIWDLMDKHKTPEATRALAKVLLAPDDLGDGFMKMMNDPDVAADARKRGFEPNPISGDDIEGLMNGLVQSPGSERAVESVSTELGTMLQHHSEALAEESRLCNSLKVRDASRCS